jgi:hypothetical protein
VLILDEVKTGLTIAAGGAVERLGAQPDVVTLAKSLGGGLPTGAVGMTAELAEPVEEGRLRLLGTYNGNPLSMAAAAASLHEVLTPAAYSELDRLGDRMVTACESVIEANGLDARCVGLGSKGCVKWAGGPELSQLIWIWLMTARPLRPPPPPLRRAPQPTAHAGFPSTRPRSCFAPPPCRWSTVARFPARTMRLSRSRSWADTLWSS